jgi:uncharacterized protein DUF4333
VSRLRPALVLVTGAALLAGACSSGGSQELDLGKAERTIRALAVKEYGGQVRVGGVQCPQHVAQEKGKSFTCTVNVAGQPLTIRVSQKDDKGNVHIGQVDAVISTRKAEAYVEQYAQAKGNPTTAVSCGRTAVIVRPPGEVITCQVRYADGATGVARMQVGNVNGTVGMQRLTHQ